MIQINVQRSISYSKQSNKFHTNLHYNRMYLVMNSIQFTDSNIKQLVEFLYICN